MPSTSRHNFRGAIALGLLLVCAACPNRNAANDFDGITCVERDQIRRLHHSIYHLEHDEPVDEPPSAVADRGPQHRAFNAMVDQLEVAQKAAPGERRALLEALRADLSYWACLPQDLHDAFHDELGIQGQF